MKKVKIKIMFTATAIADMIAAASQLDMIAKKNPTTRTSNFYSAYGYIKLSYKLTDKNQRDQYSIHQYNQIQWKIL